MSALSTSIRTTCARLTCAPTQWYFCNHGSMNMYMRGTTNDRLSGCVDLSYTLEMLVVGRDEHFVGDVDHKFSVLPLAKAKWYDWKTAQPLATTLKRLVYYASIWPKVAAELETDPVRCLRFLSIASRHTTTRHVIYYEHRTRSFYLIAYRHPWVYGKKIDIVVRPENLLYGSGGDDNFRLNVKIPDEGSPYFVSIA